ncbi:unnamed protein product [Rhizophagus irregularis]|uniref:Uncharacterized protein n=1 Tax=Rhizophagus irregularis TaxID=588596 RepID=A0A915ZSW9_9GLOM|nr:unnamed protein product [Rhizophagus irregularis]CAB4432634.1 unnamed protein product [Rhizophagus irregularis]CAB4491550.1 unnamed protein product [Rhizophagus irregularis]CAB5188289.1 unnamed protein product [Rhizophagus irregularis]CAB5389734.1 unnamed protein product [Rhizophagus irregularis]
MWEVSNRYCTMYLGLGMGNNSNNSTIFTVNKVTNTLKEKRSQNVLVSSKEIRVILDEFEENKGEFKL